MHTLKDQPSASRIKCVSNMMTFSIFSYEYYEQ